MLSEEAKLSFFEDRIEAVPLTNGGIAYIQRPIAPYPDPNPNGRGVLGADEDAEKSYTCTYRVSVGPMEIALTCRSIAMMGADVDVDVDVDMVVALKLPLRELALPIGSVSGTLGTGYNTGHNTGDDNNDGGNDDGIQLKVVHPSIEGGVVGLRFVRLADASGGVLDLGPDHDPSPNSENDTGYGHDTGHDSAAILHWNVSAFERSYVDEIKLFRVGQAGI